jgi:3-hydroxyisobutyrate dehydrogenase-like beta-hydroxyacid dehydrogenase
MTVVAVVGLGMMGSRFARRLAGAGHDVVVWNRTPSRTVELADLGAKVAQSPAEAARLAEVVMTMLTGPEALEQVTTGDEGITAGVDGATTVIEMSTVGPASVEWLRSALPEETGLLDAPVLGSISEVEAGSLRIFVGGPEALVDRWTPLLSSLGTPVRVGSLGAGARAKLVANSTLLGVLGVLGEAVALADALGLSREAAWEVLAATPIAAQAERRRGMIEGSEGAPLRYSLGLARKDADLIAAAADDHGADLRLAEAVRTWLAEAAQAGRADEDYSAVLAHILERR